MKLTTFVINLVILTLLLNCVLIYCNNNNYHRLSKRFHVKSRTHTKTKLNDYQFDDRLGKFTQKMAEGYRDIAGLGYCDTDTAEEQLEELKKPLAARNKHKIGYLFAKLFEKQKWEHITTFTDAKLQNFSYTI